MLGTALAGAWLSGAWYDAPAGPVLRDVNGNILTEGDTVTVTCTITTLTATDSLFGTATLATVYGEAATIGPLSTLNLAKET